jgi:anti-sigma B factor antagonist
VNRFEANIAAGASALSDRVELRDDGKARGQTEMELTVTHEPGYVWARTVGSIDESAGALFHEYLFPLVGCSGTKLVLDLAQSKFITSAGLGQLVLLVVRANTNSSHVVLAACSPFISVVFERSKLSTFFTLAETVEQAVEMLT